MRLVNIEKLASRKDARISRQDAAPTEVNKMWDPAKRENDRVDLQFRK